MGGTLFSISPGYPQCSRFFANMQRFFANFCRKTKRSGKEYGVAGGWRKRCRASNTPQIVDFKKREWDNIVA
ncbi:hypothetical protein HMPREF0262_03472 [Clostridium sp. ATCC 29733]|nr:hypothetical protein HMPREF0262_03472 [Clostridium sp. ATCC 29733]